MRHITMVLFLFIPFFINAQLQEKPSAVIPQIIKQGGYNLIFSEDNISCKITAIDSEGNEQTKLEFSLPEKFGKYSLFYAFGENLFFLKFSKTCDLSVYSINTLTGEGKQYPKLALGDREEMGIGGQARWSITVREDGSLFLLCSSGRVKNETGGTIYWIINVFSVSNDFTTVNWKYSVPEPQLEGKKTMADFKSFKNLGANEFVLSFEGGVQGNLNKLSNYTYLYKHTDEGLINTWKYSIPQVQPKDHLEGEPFVFLNKDKAFRYFIPTYKANEKIKIDLKDEENNIVQTYVTDFTTPGFTAKYYIDLSTRIYFKDVNKETCNVLLTIEDGRKVKGKHPKYFVNLTLNKDGIESQYFIDGKDIPLLRVPKRSIVVNEFIMFEGLLLYIKKDQIYYEQTNGLSYGFNYKGTQLYFGSKI